MPLRDYGAPAAAYAALADRQAGEFADPVFHCTATDLLHYAQQLRSPWQFKYDQLDGGRFEGRFVEVRMPGLRLFKESTSRSLRQHGTLQPGTVSLVALLEGRGEITVNGVRACAGELVVVHDRRIEAITPAEAVVAGAVVDFSLLKQATRTLLDRRLRRRAGVLTHALSEQQPARTLLTAMISAVEHACHHSSVCSDPRWQQRTQHDVLSPLVSVLDDASASSADDARVVKRRQLFEDACELLMAPGLEAASLEHTCHVLGVGQRTLTYCFQALCGMPPSRYVRALRLNGARRSLLRAPANLTVHDVALGWGFHHFGRFSCEYRRQFCETPSESLQRGRRQERRVPR